MLGREVISKDEMVGKIKAAIDARGDPYNILIMARARTHTDALNCN